MNCPHCNMPSRKDYKAEFQCGSVNHFWSKFHRSDKCYGNEIAQLKANVKRLESGLTEIANCQDAPSIDIGGDAQFGLHCGVEDRGCRDRYEGANHGYSRGVQRTLEWAVNTANHALNPEATP